MGILVRTTGAVVFLPAEKNVIPRIRKFPSKFGFYLVGILYTGSSDRKEFHSNSGGIMSNPLKSLKKLAGKDKKRSDPKEGEVIEW